MSNGLGSLLGEGKLIVKYQHRETKMEEFKANSDLVLRMLIQMQSDMSETYNAYKDYLEFYNEIRVESEEEAEKALLNMEDFVSFYKQDIELLKRLKKKKLEQRINDIPRNWNLKGRLGLISKEILKKKYWAEDERLVLIKGGFGAEANRIGRAIYVTFLSDFEETRYNRNNLECIFCDDINSLIDTE